ncbi:MAG: FG-GAP-like repeat-containing protein [Gammaproteobacteria bacterium]|nr:FG-GAP-like repeat-containing protein [Gammaproteobacteria bacterium]
MATKKGGSRVDILVGGTGPDTLIGLAGNDRLNGGRGNDTLLGGPGNDVLVGGAGDDVLSGDSGRDSLRGDAGDDTYVLDGVSEIDKRLADPGIDTVKASVSYILGAQQERLTLTGSAGLTGTGNGGANILNGNGGGNRLDGLAGADSLRGGAGNDVLLYDSADLVQSGGAGIDTLLFSGAGLALTTGHLARASSIEVLDIRGAGENSLQIDAARAISLSDTDTVRIRADADDAVSARGAWATAADAVIDGVTYAQYTLGGATLQVEAAALQWIGAALRLVNLNGTDGFRLAGNAAGDGSGRGLGGAGDVNGDGFDDLLIGAQFADPHGSGSGSSYVVFGQPGGFAANFNLGAVDGSNGFRLDGVAEFTFSGRALGIVGDINGDGFDDMLIGSQIAEAGGGYSGSTYLVFGRQGGFAANIDLASLDGTTGFRLDSATPGDRAGFAVSGAGDFNGDGFDDLLIGAFGASPNGNYSGATYVVFGRADGFTATVDLASLDGTNGLRLDGVAARSNSGQAGSAAGDVNGDGIDDLLIGAPQSDGPNGSFAGAGFVVFGQRGAFAQAIDLSTLDGSNGFRLDGAAYDRAGIDVSAAGDVNGDGFGDVLLGTEYSGPSGEAPGTAYVVFGSASGFAPNIDLTALDGTQGFRIGDATPFSRTGSAVSAAGDVNGDGYDDLLIGAPHASPGGRSFAGAGYIVFGQQGGFSANVSLATLDGTNGIRLEGATAGDTSGATLSAAGDVNGDGYDDVLVGGPGADPNGPSSGASYVIFGRDFSGAVVHQGGVDDDALTGTSAGESLVGGLGADLIDGGGGADVLRGGAGNDVLVWHEGIRDIDGGSGLDTLRITGGGVTLDLDLVADSRINGIERIDLGGIGDNALSLDVRDVLALPDRAGQLRATATRELMIDGDSGDSFSAVGQGWVADGNVTIAGVVYAAYTHGEIAVSLFVDIDITRSVS